MTRPLEQCTAIVTGATRGVGRGVAVELAAQGAVVYVTGRTLREGDSRWPGSLESTIAEAEALGGRIVGLVCDHRDDEQVRAVFDRVRAEQDRLDLLVNNVGNYIRKDLFEMSAEEWRDQLESNLYATYFCMREAVPLMRKAGFGRVVNIGYAAGERPTFNRLTVPYHIAKTGIATLTRSAAAAVAKQGITINTIGVGIMENSVVKPIDPPAGRFAEYKDLCNALAFFLSADSDHVNGTQLDVSGGWIPEQIL